MEIWHCVEGKGIACFWILTRGFWGASFLLMTGAEREFPRFRVAE